MKDKMKYTRIDNLKKKWRYAMAGLLLMCTASCSDFLDVETHHAASESQQWETLEDTRAALMGVYGLMRSALADNNTNWVCGELRLGDFTVTERTDLQAVVDNDLNTNIRLIADVSDWRRFYAVVNAASVFIEKSSQVIGKDQAYSEQNLEYDKAQARALRALAYFYMVRIWGDVPLINYAYDNGSFPQAARTPAKDVLAYIKDELLAAANALPFEYGSKTNQYYRQDPSYWYGILLNKLSAYAILAHVSALTDNYADVETYTAYVIDNCMSIGVGAANKMYIPVSGLISPTGLFSSENTTYAPNRLVAFNFQNKNNESTQSGHLEQWTLASPYVQRPYPDLYVSRDSLVNIFDNVDDLRFGIDDSVTVTYNKSYVDMTTAYPIFKKVNVVQGGAGKDGDYGVFGSTILFTRMEDMVLLRAEAVTVLNRPEDAIQLLNNLRAQRGLAQLSYKKDFGEDRLKVLDAVFDERRRELMGEGWRWYDQVRRQKIRRDNPAFLKMIEAGGEYWPVSSEVLKTNPKITQNAYWEK